MSENLSFLIGGRPVGPGHPCWVVAEVAQAHDGSLGMAHSFIDSAAAAGAHAIKFQTHIAAAESTALEPFRVKFSRQDATRYDYWKRMEFSAEGWAGLAQHAQERGLIFLSSPFSEAAVDLLEKLGMPAWKIASGEVDNPLLMQRIFATGAPILLSSGMSSLAELDGVVADIRLQGLPLLVFQCTSKYPSQPENIGLNMLDVLRRRYDAPVGLSDHSGKIYPGLAAVSLGAAMLEVHLTLSREMFGPDVPASLTPAELRQLVEGVQFIEQALAQPVNKDELAASLEPMRQIFGKALVLRRNLPAGHVLQAEDLTARKPASAGIPAARLAEVVGRKLAVAVAADAFLQEKQMQSGMEKG